MVSASSIRFRLLLSTAMAASVALPSAAAAQNLPVNPSAGTVTTSGDGHTMTVGLTAPRTAINWESFDVGQGYTVDFDGPNTVQAVLNRVVGDPSTGIISQSDINGALTSDPWIEVFLINPAGIMFGNGASVDVGSLVASTLNITDAEFLASGGTDGFLDFAGAVSTGVTVANGALVSTNSGKLVLIGASVNVQAGGTVSAATDVGFAAGNSVRVPASAGSPIGFQIGVPTPTGNAITIGGDVSGRRVVAFMKVPTDAVDALLLVEDTGSITATRAGGGDIVLGLGSGPDGGAANSPGTIENDGTLNASGDVIFGGSNFGGVNYPVEAIENNGPITAGGDVSMHAWRQITNTGPINAGGNVTLYAVDYSTAPDVHVSNGGDITAGGDVSLLAHAHVTSGSSIILLAVPALASSPDVQVTNTGTINAGGNVTLAGSISISDVSTDNNVAFDPAVQVLNDGAITAGENVTLSGAIDVFNVAASTIAVTADVNVSNDAPITAGGDVSLRGTIDIFNLEGTDGSVADEIDLFPTVNITNSGKVTADGSIDVDGAIDIFNLNADLVTATANVQIANDLTLAAGSDVDINGTIDLFNIQSFTTESGVAAASSITATANVGIVNRGMISAGGDVTIDAAIDLFNISVSELEVVANLDVANAGTVAADGDVGIAAAIDLFNIAGSASQFSTSAVSVMTATADLQVTNSGMISADGNVEIGAAVDMFNLAVSELDASANVGFTNSNSGKISAGGDVDIAASVGLFNIAGPRTASSSFGASTVTATGDVQVTNLGSISAGGDANIDASVDLFAISATALDIFAGVGISNSGKITAGGGARLRATIPFSAISATTFAFASDVHITNGGTISAQGDVHIFASGGDVTNSGKIVADNVFISSATSGYASASLPIRDINNSGTITARGNAQLIAGNNITNSGVIDTGGVALLNAGNVIDNSGSVSAGGDAILIAGNSILDSSGSLAGSISGADVALIAENGSVTAGTVTARDDIAIRAAGTVTTGSLTSGATVGGSGPVDVVGAADEFLSGVDLSGHDVDVDGSAIAVNVIRANGTGSDIRLRKPVTSSRNDLDFFAGGNITIDGAASAIDVAMDAGGNITVDGDISARDDLALRAGGLLDVGILASGVTVGGQGPVDQDGSADALLGQTLTGHDLFVQASAVNLPQVTANGTGSDLTVIATTGGLNIDNGSAGGTITLTKEGTTGILTAATLTAGTGVKLRSATDIEAGTVKTTAGDLDFGAAGDVTVDSSLEATDVAIDAGGDISTGAISARDDIALRAGGTLDVGLLTSGVTVGGTGPLDTAGAADAMLGQTLTGHDLFVQAAEVSLPQVTANGTDSDLTVIATAGPLTVTNGSAGGTITLTKQGAGGILSGGTLNAGTGVKLRSSTDIVVATVATASGDLDFAADGDVTAGGALSGTDVAIAAGGTITTGNISARDDIALRAGDTLHTGTLASGVTVGGQGPVDSSGAADALLGAPLDGHDLSVEAGHVDLASATANGSGSDLVVRATSGDLSVANGTAGGSISLTKEGASGTLTAGTLVAGTGASLTSSTGIAASNVESTAGDIDFDAVQGVSVGTVLAQAGDVNILADDLDISGGITGSDVSITNRDGGNLVTALGDASATGAFALTEAELGRIHSGTLTIDSLGQDLLVGNVAFADGAGSTRINLLGTGRVDIVGEVSGSGAGRTLQIGGTRDAADPNDPATLANIIRIAPQSSGGGRIIFAGGSLDLRGAKIGVGLDDGFLTPLGLTAGGSPASTAVVQNDWIGNFRSSLYGIPGGYADPVVISAGTITVTYADYALFQNTAGRGPGSGVNADVLNIISSGEETNGFELFGTIDQVGGVGAAFLVQPQFVSLPNSRINGCLILTGGGCGGGGIIVEPPFPAINPPGPPVPTGPDGGGEPGPTGAGGDNFSQQDLVSSGDDEAFSFDSLVGTNNEGLLGVMGVDDATDQPCAPDDKRENCRIKERANEQ